MKSLFVHFVLLLTVVIVQAQQPSMVISEQPALPPAEVLYLPGMNVDSLDKVSPVPRLLFIPEMYRSEYIHLWGNTNLTTITIAILPDHLVERMRERIEKLLSNDEF
jgi:hypothetical protein